MGSYQRDFESFKTAPRSIAYLGKGQQSLPGIVVNRADCLNSVTSPLLDLKYVLLCDPLLWSETTRGPPIKLH